jgi:hypothetical protein
MLSNFNNIFLIEVFKSVKEKKTAKNKKTKTKKKPTCQLVSDLDVVGGL